VTGAALRLQILGPLRASRGPHHLDLGPTKQMAVFTALALQSGRVVPLGDLERMVWGERPPARARQLVHTYIARLRKVLEPGTPQRQRVNVIASTPIGYTMLAEAADIDLVDFHAAVLRARRLRDDGEAVAALDLFDQALAMWQDPGLSQLSVLLRTAAEVDLLRLRWIEAAREQVQLGLWAGRAAQVRRTASRLAGLEPLDEQAQALYLAVLGRSGQRAAALNRFGEVSDLLRRDLGVEPGPVLQAAYRKLVQPAPAYRLVNGSGTREHQLLHRGDEVREVAGALEDHCLVTVSGLPGCGKSALAGAVVHRLRSRFSRVVEVDLLDLTDRLRLRERVIDLLGGPPSDPGAREAERILVLLDNAEHLVDACALLADTLLRGTERFRILVTSREPLGLPAENVRRLAPLPLTVPGRRGPAPAVDLFVRRATQACREFRVTDVNLPLVERVCRRLDGLPLALEYAAAHLAEGSLEAVLHRLDGTLTDFGPPPGASFGRPGQLGAMLGRSLSTLTADERWFFMRLGGLPPVFGLAEAAEPARAHPGGDLDVAWVLARLENRSLLSAEPGGRYRCAALLRRLAAELYATEAIGVEPV
jgi:DNA-binding SARP family transcriptional activator